MFQKIVCKIVLLALFSQISSVILFSSKALATHATECHFYNVYLHFSKSFFGKEVKSVMAHVGVEIYSSWYYGRSSWEDVKDVFLSNQDNHFFAKVKLSTKISPEAGIRINGPIVEYWIDFTDGSSTHITRSGLIDIIRSSYFPNINGYCEPNDSAIFREEDLYFNSINDADKTYATEMRCSYAS